MTAVVADPSQAEALAYPKNDDLPIDALDIDKSWHLIPFLLNGAIWGGVGPLANAVPGGVDHLDRAAPAQAFADWEWRQAWPGYCRAIQSISASSTGRPCAACSSLSSAATTQVRPEASGT